MSFKVKDELLRRSCEWTSKCIVFLALSSSFFYYVVPSLTLFFRYAPYPPYRFLSVCAVTLLTLSIFTVPLFTQIHLYMYTHTHTLFPSVLTPFIPACHPSLLPSIENFFPSFLPPHTHIYMLPLPPFPPSFIIFLPFIRRSFLLAFVPSFLLSSFFTTFLRSFVPSFHLSCFHIFLFPFVPFLLLSFCPSFLLSCFPPIVPSIMNFLPSFLPSHACIYHPSCLFSVLPS